MASFNYTVDTRPMAEEMKSVSRHVDGTTGAVIAMKTAVIAAEAKATEHVCQNVNRGFYSLIHSQISQKMAKLQSEVDSHLMSLNQQARQLRSIRNRMERDYQMICSRYTKLFNGININLRQRIYELDKPTFDFASKEMGQISNRPNLMVSTVPVAQLEGVDLSQRMVASNLKYRSQKLIDTMHSFLEKNNEQKALTEKILLPDAIDNSHETLMIPVIVSESVYGSGNIMSDSAVVSKMEMKDSSESSIKEAVISAMPEMPWHPQEALDKNLTGEFISLVEKSDASQRVKDLINKLFQSSVFETN